MSVERAPAAAAAAGSGEGRPARQLKVLGDGAGFGADGGRVVGDHPRRHRRPVGSGDDPVLPQHGELRPGPDRFERRASVVGAGRDRPDDRVGCNGAAP